MLYGVLCCKRFSRSLNTLAEYAKEEYSCFLFLDLFSSILVSKITVTSSDECWNSHKVGARATWGGLGMDWHSTLEVYSLFIFYVTKPVI